MTTFLASPDNWFDLPREAAAAAAARSRLTLALTGADGYAPLADVRLDELLAVHKIFGAWWAVLGGNGWPASLDPAEYGRFFAASRSLLQERASVSVANPDSAMQARTGLLALPSVGHVQFAQPAGALEFLKPFIALEHAPSLIAWVRTRATAPDASELCRRHAWVRLLLQKVASEDRLPEALACLRATYDTSPDSRGELLAEEAELLAQTQLQDLRTFARSLGIDRAPRTQQGIPTTPRRSSSTSVPDLTVIVPSFQHESFVEAALESVLAQTYSAFRILVVDDGSTDGTVERARLFSDPRIAVRVNDRNIGLGNSLLRALADIDTPYVALLNSDDLFHPDRIERCRAVLEQETKVQVLATGLVPIDRSGHRLTAENSSRLFDGDAIADWTVWFASRGQVDAGADLFSALLERNFLATSSNIVCRTDFLRSSGEALRGLNYCVDWQLLLDAAADEALRFLPDELLGYRLHDTNTVWFDEPRRLEYMHEVNRVLATALNRWRDRAALRPGGVDVATGLDLIVKHAAKHRDASGTLMFATSLLGKDAFDRSTTFDGTAQPVVRHPDSWTRDDVLLNASKALALIANEVQTSPEWKVGQVLWHRLQVSRIAYPAARMLSWLVDRRNRWRLTRGRFARTLHLGRPRAVVASSWRFPVNSHTFVYQEMQALEWMGLDPLVFCCAANDKRDLHAPFAGLWPRRVVLRTEQQRNREDFEHFLRTRRGLVETLLARLTAASGLDRDALLREPAMMMAFTFARHVELSGAVYLHTYFFYDQSLMALVASFLLGVPRGITAYADHMLQDYPLKCVALHLELADIVVATSRRIKGELSAIGGGRFDSKILVKPNGVDTSRFTYAEAAARIQPSGPFELISVSRIEPKKGLVHLVEAVDLLRSRGLAVRLNIVGGADPYVPASADYLRELKDAIAERGLADLVTLHGMQTQTSIAALLGRAHVYVAPYVELASGDKDGIPTSLLEAMATGLPVVATDSGSIVEAFTDGVEGFCVPQRDAGPLADAIQRLLLDQRVYAQMSAAARKRAVSEFDARVTEARLHDRIRAALAAAR